MDIKRIEQTDHLRQPALNRITNDKGFKQVFNSKLSEIDKVSLPAISDHETDVINHSDNVLNLLDDYANELSNHQKTLKEIEPIVTRIEKEMSIVESKTADIVTKNGKLSNL